MSPTRSPVGAHRNPRDRHAAAEYERLDRSLLHRAEFALSVELLDEYVAPGAEVLDVGAGPGRYAEQLLGRGCRVGLTDLSANSLELFSQRIEPHLADGVLFCRQGSATDLGWLASDSFDVVLLMGPLYHLVNRVERHAALREAWRVLRPDGVVVAAYISPYKNLVEAIADGDEREVERLCVGGPTTGLRHLEHVTRLRKRNGLRPQREVPSPPTGSVRKGVVYGTTRVRMRIDGRESEVVRRSRL